MSNIADIWATFDKHASVLGSIQFNGEGVAYGQPHFRSVPPSPISTPRLSIPSGDRVPAIVMAGRTVMALQIP